MHDFFQINLVEKRLNLFFRNPALLLNAFVHRSFWNENHELVAHHNERLEFLGDSILGLIIGEYLFQHYPKLDEGSLSQLRSQLVDAPACSQYIQSLNVEEFLLLGKGEKMNQGKGRESIHADLFEAIVAALYLDQGLESVRHFFFSRFKTQVDQLIASPLRNWKAELQDWGQKNFQETPIYKVLEELGPAHKKSFRISVWVKGKERGEGSGSSKKEAQTNAAKSALLKIEGGKQ